MKLNKIRLVNWHIFNNHTVDINGNVVITGANGHGKSTLIDALFFVLSGGDENCFNNAAHAKSQRTVETYVRCKTGAENKEFLRSQSHLIGHVALEFLDNKNKKYILGVVIEFDNKKQYRYFYSAEGFGVDDVPYIDDKDVIADWSAIKKVFGESLIDLVGKSKRDIRKYIADMLQLVNGDAYNTLLKKAVSFAPLTNEITSFVNGFLLKEDNIDIDILKEEIDSYRQIKKVVDKENEKLACLSSFVKEGEEYQKNAEKLNYLNTITYKKRIEAAENKLASSKVSLGKIDEKISQAKFKRDDANKLKNDYKRQVEDLENQDEFKVLKENKDQLNDLFKDLDSLEQKQKRYESIIANEQHIVDDLDLDFNFNKLVAKQDIASLNAQLKDYKNAIERILEDESKKSYDCTRRIEDNADVINENKAIIKDLEKGINRYDRNTVRLMAELKYALRNIYKEDINILPLCECFEITDERWRNAIEGYLSRQRFELVCEPKHFKDALKVYNKIADQEHIYEVGLIDTTNTDEIPVSDNSLFTKIRVSNVHALNKLKLLLGNVICVDNVEDLNNYQSAITDSCMLFKNLSAKRLNPQRYEQHYIGVDSQKQRMETLKAQVELLEKQNAEINEERKQHQEITNTIKQSQYHNETFDNVWFHIDHTNEQIAEFQASILELEQSKGMIELNEEIQKFNSLYIKYRDIYNFEDKQCEELQNNRGRIQQELEFAEKEITDNQELYDLDITNKKYDNTYFEYEKAVLESKTLDIVSEKEYLYNRNRTLKNGIEKGITEYHERFEKSYGTSVDDINSYIQKYNNIKNTNIINFQTAAQEAYKNARTSFNEKFVSTLRSKIRHGQKSLDDLNKILKNHPFGLDKEIYKFEYAGSLDDDLGKYYRVINSGKGMGNEGLLVEEMPEKDQEIIRDLFERIASETDDVTAESDLHKLLDYRSYMRYDIEIKNNKGQTFKFSKIAREKSGGETQTPFYIIIAACFEQLLKPEARNSSCIIVLDEAFNNMDETRISTLLDYYKQLTKIQFLIGVPTNRAPLLIPSMDLCIGLLKHDNTVKLNYERRINK